jgi:hypothetical protein
LPWYLPFGSGYPDRHGLIIVEMRGARRLIRGRDCVSRRRDADARTCVARSPNGAKMTISPWSLSTTINCSLRMEDLCWVYNHAAAHRMARVCSEDVTVDGLHFAPEVMSWPLLPRSRNT